MRLYGSNRCVSIEKEVDVKFLFRGGGRIVTYSSFTFKTLCFLQYHLITINIEIGEARFIQTIGVARGPKGPCPLPRF